MKKIDISTNEYPDTFALVDDKDFEMLNQYKWRKHSKGYAIRMVGRKPIYMHRLINKTLEGLETDHINGDKLDNRRSNLRSASRTLNKLNKRSWKHNTSGHRGVTFLKKVGKWRSQMQVGGKNIVLGVFDRYEDAVKARKLEERSRFGLVLD